MTRKTNLEVLGDLTDEALEGELADEELGRLLVAADFTEGDGSGPEAMGLLDTAGRGGCGGLARRGLGSELLTGRLATGGLAGSLLGTGHCDEEVLLVEVVVVVVVGRKVGDQFKLAPAHIYRRALSAT